MTSLGRENGATFTGLEQLLRGPVLVHARERTTAVPVSKTEYGKPCPPVQEHAHVLIYLRVLIFCVFLFVRPPCAVFPALFVCRNMDWNVDDPSFWFNDVLAARDEDEVVLCLCRHVLKSGPWDLWDASG